MDLDPGQLSTTDRYKLLIGAIVPRPIALVSTLGPDGTPNLAPFSFFAGVSSEPMTLLFCPANKSDGSMKDTLCNSLPLGHPDLPATLALGSTPRSTPEHQPALSRGQGEFVVNIVSRAFAERMAACAEELRFGESEFALSGLSRAPSRVVAPSRVAESLVSFECRTEQVIRLAPGTPSGGNIVLGRVLHVHASERVINERLHIDPDALDAIGRMGGLGYCTTRDRFAMPMGAAALKPVP